MNGLLEVTRAIEARMTDVLTKLGVAVPEFFFGEDKLRREGNPPRIVWVPRRGPTDRDIMPAADYPENWTEAGDPPLSPKPAIKTSPLWSRRVGFDVHVWAIRPGHRVDADDANDYPAAEQLVNHLVAATHDVMWGSYAMKSEDWTTTQASSQRHGVVVVVGMELWLTWTRELFTNATVTAMPITPGGTI